MKICFVTNTLSTKNEGLTTHDLAYAAFARGHEVMMMTVKDFYSIDNDISGRVRVVQGEIEERKNLTRKRARQYF